MAVKQSFSYRKVISNQQWNPYPIKPLLSRSEAVLNCRFYTRNERICDHNQRIDYTQFEYSYSDYCLFSYCYIEYILWEAIRVSARHFLGH